VNISQASINCFYEARDFTLYFSNYDTSLKQVSTTWAQSISKQYLAIHSYFKELVGYLDREQYQQYATTLDSMFVTVFGQKNATDD
jgi:type II secretory pathway component PulK